MSLEAFVTDARSLFTVISMATFIGIALWAWSARRSAAFAEAANLPFADDVEEDQRNLATENHHG